MAYAMTTPNGKRTERKMLLTVAEWKNAGSGSSATYSTVVLGARTEDSSIEFNSDLETVTDILGINYTDLNKTQPQQTFDPAHMIGGDALMQYLSEHMLMNDINAVNNNFNVYIIEAYLSETTTGQTPEVHYRAHKHKNCSIIPSSIGGDAWVSMPFDVYFSNDIVNGYVDSIDRSELVTTGATAEGLNSHFIADT